MLRVESLFSPIGIVVNNVGISFVCGGHPRRPRGSQSDREKRRDKNFHVRAKELLGTDSYRTIFKNSSGCRLLIVHKKCFVLLCPIVKQFFSWVRTRRLLSRHTCQVRSPSLCVQGKLLFSTFLTRNEGTTDESKKTFGMLSAGAIEFAPRIFCFWRITMYRKFLRCGGNEKVRPGKSNKL